MANEIRRGNKTEKYEKWLNEELSVFHKYIFSVCQLQAPKDCVHIRFVES